MKRKAPGGGTKWQYNTVLRILTNEKYAGIALLQKTFTPDCLTHKSVQNNGELRKVIVRNSHPAIIDLDTFRKTQNELIRRGYSIPKNIIID